MLEVGRKGVVEGQRREIQDGYFRGIAWKGRSNYKGGLKI